MSYPAWDQVGFIITFLKKHPVWGCMLILLIETTKAKNLETKLGILQTGYPILSWISLFI